jgi:hypothetical protein
MTKKKRLAVLSAAVVMSATNISNAQTWFEGEAEYECSVSAKKYKSDKSVKEFKSSNPIVDKEYYKAGNIKSEMNLGFLGRLTTVFNHQEQVSYFKGLFNSIETEKISEKELPQDYKIDRNIVEINGYKCIKITYYSNDEATSIDWVDESYNIPYYEGRITEIPKGLVVRSEESVSSSKFGFSYKRELKEIKKKEVSDSNFKL